MPKKPNLAATLKPAKAAPTKPQALDLMPCPFCGRAPHAQYWHGGRPQKTLIRCPAEYVGDCGGQPSITGETPKEAAKLWNTRRSSSGLVRVDVTGTPTDFHGGEG